MRNKIIRSFCITTELSPEGELLCYSLTFPVSKEYVENYGLENIIRIERTSKPKLSSDSKKYNLYFYKLVSRDFKFLKCKVAQLQLNVSSLKIKLEIEKHNYLKNKMKNLYEID